MFTNFQVFAHMPPPRGGRGEEMEKYTVRTLNKNAHGQAHGRPKQVPPKRDTHLSCSKKQFHFRILQSIIISEQLSGCSMPAVKL